MCSIKIFNIDPNLKNNDIIYEFQNYSQRFESIQQKSKSWIIELKNETAEEFIENWDMDPLKESLGEYSEVSVYIKSNRGRKSKNENQYNNSSGYYSNKVVNIKQCRGRQRRN